MTRASATRQNKPEQRHLSRGGRAGRAAGPVERAERGPAPERPPLLQTPGVRREPRPRAALEGGRVLRADEGQHPAGAEARPPLRDRGHRGGHDALAAERGGGEGSLEQGLINGQYRKRAVEVFGQELVVLVTEQPLHVARHIPVGDGDVRGTEARFQEPLPAGPVPPLLSSAESWATFGSRRCGISRSASGRTSIGIAARGASKGTARSRRRPTASTFELRRRATDLAADGSIPASSADRPRWSHEAIAMVEGPP